MKMTRVALLTAALALLATAARAEVKLHTLFSDGAVLQRGVAVPVWGAARDGEKVTVKLAEQTATTTAAGGKWSVKLKPLPAGGPHTMTVSGDNTVEVKNVLIGEVWLCSGQSNMQWAVSQSADAQAVIAAANDPRLRLFTVPRRAVDVAQSELNGNQQESKWNETKPETIPGFSAVAYHFGKHLRQALDVPIGLISTNVGGTPAEAWTSREVLLAGFPEIVKNQEVAIANFANGLKTHEAAVEKAKAEGKTPPRAPADPRASMQRPSGLYNAMIAPLAPYAVKGAIWYQGESNAGRAYQYRALFPAMIKNWRELWGQGDFAFLFVQLAPFMAIVNEPQESAWAELREAQLLALKASPKTGMAVITDVGEPADIHPKQKEPVGARLALAARAIANGERIVFSGPVYKAMKVDGNRAWLSFDHVGGGLAADDDLTGFAVCGDDRKFVNAQARIDGNRVVVWAAEVSKPVAVRYGWANFPVVNLKNKEGLPATPFRTDDFAMVTKPK